MVWLGGEAKGRANGAEIATCRVQASSRDGPEMAVPTVQLGSIRELAPNIRVSADATSFDPV